MKPELGKLKLSVRAPGGRWSAPWLSIWGPVVARIAAGLAALVVLAIIGSRAAAQVWSPLPGLPVLDDAGAPAIAASSGQTLSPTTVPLSRTEGGARSSAILADGRIVLNVADEEQLVRLPGVGPARARAIVALRQRLGKFRTVEQLRRVKGIGRKTLQRIAPHVVVDAPQDDNIVKKDAG